MADSDSSDACSFIIEATESSSSNSSFWRMNSRRKAGTVDRRKAATIRERRRLKKVNDAFEQLRKRACRGQGNPQQRMAKVEILRAAIEHIKQLDKILRNHGEQREAISRRLKHLDWSSFRKSVSESDGRSSIKGEYLEPSATAASPSTQASSIEKLHVIVNRLSVEQSIRNKAAVTNKA